MAEKVYVTRQTISNWENGKNYPDVKSLLLLSTLFHISLDTLVKGDLEEMREQIKAEDIKKWNRDVSSSVCSRSNSSACSTAFFLWRRGLES